MKQFPTDKKIPGTENFLPFFFEKLDSILDLITDQKIIFNETNIDFFSSYFDELKKNYEKSKYIDFLIFSIKLHLIKMKF